RNSLLILVREADVDLLPECLCGSEEVHAGLHYMQGDERCRESRQVAEECPGPERTMPGERAERLLKVARSPRGIRKFERAPSTVGERNGHAVLVPELTEQLRRLGRVLDARVEVAGPPGENGEVHGDERHDHAVPGHSRSLSNCREPPASFVEVPASS